MQINFFIGLILDIIFVAVLKAVTRRRRPSDDPYAFGPDKYSFPSGHASRSIFVLIFFTVLSPISIFFWPPIFAWAMAVCVSRILLSRHHILDIIAGILLGLFEIVFLSIIWFDKEWSEWIMLWLADDRSQVE